MKKITKNFSSLLIKLGFKKQTKEEKHPKELLILAICGMGLRFSFWGVGNLLVLYLIESLQLKPSQATHIYGMFTGFAAFLPLAGGFVADRWNYHSPLFLGIIATTIGCFLLCFHNLIIIYIALMIIACGYGIFVPSIFAILNHVYKDKNKIREVGFTLYYSTFNIGVFLAMIILGYVGHAYGWNIAFFIAGISQLLTLIAVFYYYKKYHIHYTNLHPTEKKEKEPTNIKMQKYEKDRMIVILIITLSTLFFWTAYTQGWSSMSIITLKYTNREFFNFEIPPAWILSFESLFLIILSPLMAKLYGYLKNLHKNPSPSMKAAYSLFATSLCFFIMVIACLNLPNGANWGVINPIYLILSYFVLAIAELLIGPISISLVTQLSPKKLTAFLVGFLYVTAGISYYLGGLLAGLIQYMSSKASFFMIFVLLCAIPATVLLLFTKKLNKMRHMDML